MSPLFQNIESLRTFEVQYHMTSQVKDVGKHSHRVTEVCQTMDIKKDGNPLKSRHLTGRNEIYNRYTSNQKSERQTVSSSLK